MFDKKRAKKFYKEMLKDMMEIKKILEKTDEYDGVDKGFVIVPKKKDSKKISYYLADFATNDNYNLQIFDVQKSIDGSEATLYIIDNDNKEPAKIISLNNYRKWI